MKESQNTQSPRPLCVDLDGTLIWSDLLVESIFALLKINPLYLFLLPVWLLEGKAHLKQQLANRVELDVSLLPYNQPFIEYLKQERAAGRQIILATASNIKLAQQVALYLDLFDSTLASDAQTNLSSSHKLKRLEEVFGKSNFDYAGNAKADLPIWEQAGEAIVVNPERGILHAATQVAQISKVFPARKVCIKDYINAMRLYHWPKNLLIFIPIVLAHQTSEAGMLLNAILAFLAFGFCASSVYLLNDLLDLSADRKHPTKRNRPFAASRINIIYGTVLIPVLLVIAFAIALLLPLKFQLLLGLYYLLTLSYSLWFKRAALIDVIVLASLYTLRIFAGAEAVPVSISFWLLAFSMFLFLSLALVKRYTELNQHCEENQGQALGRGYYQVDMETLAHFGSTSGYMSVMVLALYINSPEVKLSYTHPEVIWFLCPLVLYFISRIWLMARRSELSEDPVVFATRDRRTQYLVLLGILLLWLAT